MTLDVDVAVMPIVACIVVDMVTVRGVSKQMQTCWTRLLAWDRILLQAAPRGSLEVDMMLLVVEIVGFIDVVDGTFGVVVLVVVLLLCVVLVDTFLLVVDVDVVVGTLRLAFWLGTAMVVVSVTVSVLSRLN